VEGASIAPAAEVLMRPRVVVLAVLGVGLMLAPLTPGMGQTKKLNPYTGKAEAIQEGRALYLRHGCSGCHGVMGGGGMAVPLIDDTWKFGSDDATLFKLIKGEIAEQTMPRVWVTLPDDEVWKMLAYIRSLYSGDPSRISW
jgi:cytochrome c(L)